MKQCDHLAIASSSLSFNASSESDPEDSFWRDFSFDFSFLTSDDPKTGGDDIDSNSSVPKESELYGLAIVDSNVKEPSPPLPSLLGVTTTTKGKEACLRNEVPFSPLFAKMSALRIKECSNGDDTEEVDSPCWKGARSPLNLRRGSRDDLNVLYGLNPMAPHFIPSSNGKEFGENGTPSLKRSLSSTFPPSSGEFSISNLYEQGSDQINHDPDESLGLVVRQEDSSNQFQRSTKLDPLAPVFVPAYAVVHDKSVVADHMMMSTERNAHSAYASSEVGHIGSVNHHSVSYKEIHAGLTHPSVPVEPSYQEVDTKQMGRHRYGNPSPQMDVKKLLTTIHGLSELLTHAHGSGSPNEQDLALINSTVQNLNSYISNRVHEHSGKYDGFTSLPNVCKQSIREHQIPKARNLSSAVEFRRKEKYPMVKGEAGAEPQVEYVVAKENGFGQVVRNHETEAQFNPQALFYKSLWLKARADSGRLLSCETIYIHIRLECRD
ncbi:hypothetical protein Rs2_04705 [Raphanus sativus]|nr:hypothetical protein Rs2_04705 [Raphanus sativus]